MALIGASTTLFGTQAATANSQIVKLSKIKVGGTYSFQLKSGEPALLFRTKTGVFAYQTICTHEGAPAKYLAPRKLIACAVHNASFDPFKGGKVVAGPNGQSPNSITKLSTVKVAVKSGWVVLL
jgi:nitrite reductase/ring-hydroxylating ferredoxin subunit